MPSQCQARASFRPLSSDQRQRNRISLFRGLLAGIDVFDLSNIAVFYGNWLASRFFDVGGTIRKSVERASNKMKRRYPYQKLPSKPSTKEVPVFTCISQLHIENYRDSKTGGSEVKNIRREHTSTVQAEVSIKGTFRKSVFGLPSFEQGEGFAAVQDPI